MTFAVRETVTVTTAADGSATAYTIGVYTGIVNSVIYTKTSYTDGVDFTITGEVSGSNIWREDNVNATETHSPVQLASLVTGVDSTITENPVYVVNERIKIVLAQGGNAHTGTFTFIIA